MMNKKHSMLAAPFLAAVAFVCPTVMAQQDTAADRAGQALDRAGSAVDRAASDAAAQVAGARQGNMDQKFAMRIADMNNFEIQAGRLAQEKAQSDEIKQLAKMTVEDHTQAQQQLQQIAQKKNMQLPSTLMPVHQAMLQDLSQMEGQEFEKAYLYGQVAGHVKTSLKLRDAKTTLQDPELKQYAATIMPKVQQHLQHAQQLANANEAMPAGARIGGSSGDASGHGADHAQPGAGATDRLRPATGSGGATGDNAAPNNTDNTGGGGAGRGASPTRGADAPGAGPSSPDSSR